ncbi:MAG: SufS family cysteine desulfurase [Candidatus Roizmanbacteria bacterium]|nr:MAG: SufS family cysteine desulfurase [Candidatus Roizmanbacteria bacterium]
MINVNQIKKDFPIFQHDPSLVYLDSCATSLKPKQVIDKIVEYYSQYCANIMRGIYKISEKATEEYEDTRKVVAEFINAYKPEEIIFTRNTTESINLVAYALGRQIIDSDSEVITSIMEHHSNFIPWQQLAFENAALLKVIDVDEEGCLKNMDRLEQIVTKKTKILALTYVSNVFGTINPIKEIVRKAKKINPQIITVIDAAQAVPHFKVDVQNLGCDFLAFSSHKMFGPTGVGVLWGRYDLLEKMYPFQYGGEMIEEVTLEKSVFQKPPHKYEAGTPNIADVIAFKEAIFYLKQIGADNVRTHEKNLTYYALKRLNEELLGKIKIFGPRKADDRVGVISFSVSGVHPHDIAQFLDEKNIAIRAGYHCAMPLHFFLNEGATARVSFQVYNSEEDVDKLVEELKEAIRTF